MLASSRVDLEFALNRAGAADEIVVNSCAASPRVLLAEDGLVNQRIEAALLRRLGFEVIACADGVEAVEQFRSQAFDLVLLDCQMPRMSGIEAAAAIRAWESDRDIRIPIIAVTASISGEDRDLCEAVGIDFVLTKPFDQDQLWDAVMSAKG